MNSTARELKLVECGPQLKQLRDCDFLLVVSAKLLLDERMASDLHAHSSVGLQSAHQPQAGPPSAALLQRTRPEQREQTPHLWGQSKPWTVRFALPTLH